MNTTTLRRLGVMTSGGDAPGMNACIRAIVRSATYYGLEAFGVRRGYEGLIDGDIHQMAPGDVSNIIHRGGSILQTARSPRFLTQEGRALAYANLRLYGIEGLVVIGGDGSYNGARVFVAEYPDIHVVGAPGTIDNDLFGTDATIGYDTALNTVIWAIDHIRDTADAHARLFFVEVMGRDAGFIALRAGIGSGADAILVPETNTDLDALIQLLERGWKREKTSCIVVVAEGDEAGGAFEVAKIVKERLNQYDDIRVTVLGHIQRGGSPTCADRVLASRLGVAAVEALRDGLTNVATGLSNRDVVLIPFLEAVKHTSALNPGLLRLVEILSH